MNDVYKDSQTNGWIAQIQIGMYPNGRPKYRRIRAKSRKEALDKLNELLQNKQDLYLIAADEALTVSEYIRLYLETYKKNALKPSSLTRNYAILDHQILNTIGGYELTQLTTPIIQQQLINKLVSMEYSLSTIHKTYTLLNEALKCAIKEKRIGTNACDGVVMPSKNAIPPKQIEILNADEIKDFLAVAESNKYTNGLAISLILYTGLRCGELCALQWSDVNFTKKELIIQKNICVANELQKDGSRVRKVSIQRGTKTQLFRRIPLNAQALDILERLNNARKPTPKDFVIIAQGECPKVASVSKTYNRMLAYANIEGKQGIHTLRHTFASNLLSRGIDIKIVSSLLT